MTVALKMRVETKRVSNHYELVEIATPYRYVPAQAVDPNGLHHMAARHTSSACRSLCDSLCPRGDATSRITTEDTEDHRQMNPIWPVSAGGGQQ
ncbi:MAG TPA: hypothetical protein DCG12_15130 [Planctomycetaceae bacterium]|nr:hypothetical protein [Planctomycetaceae bacterium]